MSNSTVRDISSFADALRDRGMTVTPDQMSDMAQALLLVDLTSRDQVYAAMRALAITDPSHRVPYDEEFRRFFEGIWQELPPQAVEQSEAKGFAVTPILDASKGSEGEETTTKSGTSLAENLAARDFATLEDDELTEAKRIVMRMVWAPSDFKTRRWVRDRRGRRPDMRRTLHGAIGPMGDMIRIERRKRRLQQRPLIIITDISGSMERYADLFMVFAHAASRRLRHVEAFTFSTELTRITEELDRRDALHALARVTESVFDWSGGTKIGAALEQWNRSWSRRLARGRPVVLILSDGWDCGDPHLLSQEMARLARSVYRVIWLNPLAARDEYEPATRGMQAVLPHIDHLLPAASVNDLREVVALLDSLDR